MATGALTAAGEPRGLEVHAEVVEIRTIGDRVTDRPFEAIGPKGVFASEIQLELLEGRIDLAVHSLKDLPAVEPDGLVLAAVLERSEARDVLVSRDGTRLDELPDACVVGTSSARRRALLAVERPGLVTTGLRGNVGTRLRKVAEGQVDAAILAAAGIQRIGRGDAITELLDPYRFVPPPGQGAIVIEARRDRYDSDLGWIAGAEHAATRAAVDAERSFMRVVEGGCEQPLGAWARWEDDELRLDVFLASADGERHVRDASREAALGRPGAVELGRRLAERVLAAWAG